MENELHIRFQSWKPIAAKNAASVPVSLYPMSAPASRASAPLLLRRF